MGDIDQYISDLAAAIKELIKSVKLLNENLEVFGIGIGAPNGNYYSGTIEYAPNLSFKGVVRLVELLRAHFPEMEALALTNDANAAAIGEMIYGGAKDMKNFVMFTLGTGVGSGIVVNGDPGLWSRWFCRRMWSHHSNSRRSSLRMFCIRTS